MHAAVLLWASLFAGDVHDYARPLDAKGLDQSTLDAEGYGDKKVFKREDDGLHVVLPPGGSETGWKTPQAVKFGGDFTITARFLIRKLPKPAQDDGAAVGLSVATQNLDQPEVTLARMIELNDADVYRVIEKAGQENTQQQMQMAEMGMVMPAGRAGAAAKPVKPVRKTVRARGEAFALELRREGSSLRCYALDEEAKEPRYLGQVQVGSGDLAGVKLFAFNRNGGDAVDVVLKSLTVNAARITGLGTEVRTVAGAVVHGEPTGLEDGKLLVGGPSKTDAPSASASPAPAAAPAAQAGATRVMALRVAPAGVAVAAIPLAPARPVAAAPAQAAKPDEPKPQADEPKEKDKEKKPEEKKPEPKAKIPLDEVESIAFERAVTTSGRVVGQPNLDFTGPGLDKEKDKAKADDVDPPLPGTIAPAKIPKAEPKPSGIRDVHVTLSGLRSSPIKQVTINAQTDKGATAYKLDTSGSHDWPIVVRRAGTESWADLFLEPPPGDMKGKDLTVNVTYEDGQSANAQVKCEVAIDPKLAFDAKAPAPTLDARVYLAGGEQLFGKLESLGSETLKLKTPWGDALELPLAYVTGIYMGLPDHKESAESFARRLKGRGTEDLLLARSKDGEVVAIPGIAEGTEDEKLLFHFQEKTRSLSLKQVEGLVLAARPEPEKPSGLRPTFTMAGGLVVSGKWTGLEAKTWKIETAWGQPLNLPAAEVNSVRFRGGRSTYLSDLEPSKVDHTPYFGRKTPYRKDASLAGGPLKIDGRVYAHGLAVHSRTALTYDLDGPYATFEATVGFDESAGKAGRIDCRVFANDREVYANPDLRADGPPVKLNLPIAGAKRLRLVVDFGKDQDSGDRVIWADARILRAAAAEAKTTQDSKPGSGE